MSTSPAARAAAETGGTLAGAAALDPVGRGTALLDTELLDTVLLDTVLLKVAGEVLGGLLAALEPAALEAGAGSDAAAR